MVASAGKWAIAFLALLPVWGCKPSVADADARDRASPAFARAIGSERVGNLEEAIARYEAALLDQPRLFSAHLHLALLLHDHRQDYIGAIYHYRQYLALRPGGEKDEMVKGRMQLAEQLLAAQLLQRIGDIAGIAQSRLTGEIATLNGRVAALEGEKSAWAAEKESLTATLRESQAETQRLRRLVEKMQVSDVSPPPKRSVTGAATRPPPVRDDREPVGRAQPPISREDLAAAREEAAALAGGAATGGSRDEPTKPAATAPPEPRAADTNPPVAATREVRRTPELRTYVVQPGDTLYGIAERHYGDGAQWPRVQEANKSRIDTGGRVRAGQILLIP